MSRHIARLTKSESSFYGNSILDAGEIDHWITFTTSELVGCGSTRDALQRLDVALSLRTFLVGETITLADFAVWGALRSESMYLIHAE